MYLSESGKTPSRRSHKAFFYLELVCSCTIVFIYRASSNMTLSIIWNAEKKEELTLQTLNLTSQISKETNTITVHDMSGSIYGKEN